MFFRIKLLNFVKISPTKYQALIFGDYIFEIESYNGTYSVIFTRISNQKNCVIIKEDIDTFIHAKRICRLFLINMVKEILEKEE